LTVGRRVRLDANVETATHRRRFHCNLGNNIVYVLILFWKIN
jgi:hypothetical protein